MGSRSPRGSLGLHVVLDAALEIIDRVGVDGLSIRGLAQELGRPPMTLYGHFDSKRELLDLAFVRLLHRLCAFPHRPHPTWRVEAEAMSRHIRGLLLEHPNWVPLLVRLSVPRQALDVYDRLLRDMRKDGFRPEAAMFAFSSILSHALGSVLVERLLGGKPPIPKQRLELVKGTLAEMPRGMYPAIDVVSRKFDRWNFDDVFELGLHSLVRGLAEGAPKHHGHRRAGVRRTGSQTLGRRP